MRFRRQNIRLACEKTGLDCLRVVRQSEAAAGAAGEQAPQIRYVRDAAEAAEALAGTRGPVFVTTGSKELEAFARLENWQERIYVRVLPDSRVLAQCEAMGFARGHVIAMQGPVFRGLKRGHDAGGAGGVSGDQGVGSRRRIRGEDGSGGPAWDSGGGHRPAAAGVRHMGGGSLPAAGTAGHGTKAADFLDRHGAGKGPEQRTLEAERVLRQAAAAAGAPRMLESAGELLKGKPVYAGYGSEGILDWFEKTSGTGFPGGGVFRRPGILQRGGRVPAGGKAPGGGRRRSLSMCVRWPASGMAFLCARIGDFLAAGVSRQPPRTGGGRGGAAAGRHAQVFLLLEGGDGAAQVCRQLTEAGYGDARVTVGERLSYPEERVVTAAASQMGETRFDGLCAMLIRR